MRHRCLLGAREISTLAKSVSIDNHEPLAKSKLELLMTRHDVLHTEDIGGMLTDQMRAFA
jgi:hypothetical protein